MNVIRKENIKMVLMSVHNVIMLRIKNAQIFFQEKKKKKKKKKKKEKSHKNLFVVLLNKIIIWSFVRKDINVN